MKTKTKFVLSAVSPDQFPDTDRPEVAFVGRSNVGKSSLINMLVGTAMARVSSRPGMTTAINFFEIEVARDKGPFIPMMLADLPGYGFARVSKKESAGWSSFIDPYLAGRDNLRVVIVLVDSTIPAQASDIAMVQWLRGAGRRFILVGTKSDKLSPSRRQSEMKKLGAQFGSDILAVSARTGDGIEDLWRLILKL